VSDGVLAFYLHLHLLFLLLIMQSFYVTENALLGKTTYVHCKAGRGRSTTVVLCYLVSSLIKSYRLNYICSWSFVELPSH